MVARTARRGRRGRSAGAEDKRRVEGAPSGAGAEGPADSAPLEGSAPRYAAINGLIPVRDRRKLQFLSRRTRVPQSEYLREAIRDLLRKYRDAFEGSPFDEELDPL